ncbi:unnamed protein product [Oikopleura dioica]|uniref:Uncharacterized protein n=1 Tax=Oikopleura dioica TaxID=34765 RepID=E4Y3S0_OIKDI|nr:unnamed protein product [Oikopleura dioica]CBY39748.1 unnamed protein product [Oikopleura dioica]
MRVWLFYIGFYCLIRQTIDRVFAIENLQLKK